MMEYIRKHADVLEAGKITKPKNQFLMAGQLGQNVSKAAVLILELI